MVPPTLSSMYFQSTVFIMYCGIFIAALLGNGLVCYVVSSSRRMHTVTNFFIVNLAVGDILMTLFCVPFSFVATLVLQYWPFGELLCHTVQFSQVTSVMCLHFQVSAYTLVAISVDRYMAIMWPLRPRMSKHHAKITITVVWAIAIATAFPIFTVSHLSQPSPWHKSCQRFICTENWESKEYQGFYTFLLLIMQYVVPFTVLVFTYTRIAVVVWGKRIPGEAENSRDVRMARSKKKMIKMMVTVVVVFTVCWLPLNIFLLLWEQNPELSSWELMPHLFFACHWLAMSHTCYNPIIYCWMNSRFRLGFCTALGRVPAASFGRANTSSTYLSVRRRTENSLTCQEEQI
ncbi:hypothetical protein LSTR_LSTR000144 [Laodelphax striatellus]|uniref:G-protein coupled receptors family 1 profile domain-containing protein n=1 Tax=Laodelphax striatellus TaxID=195883 RepID=A0A482X7N7_LAOST|nr:hypothetical protein LSTR_LSTR000144 [Laodelphax striatellus]